MPDQISPATDQPIAPAVIIDGERITPAIVIGGEAYLSRIQLGRVLNRRERQLRTWAREGYGPIPCVIGRSIFYSLARTVDWMQRGGRRGPGRPRKVAR